MFNVAVHAETQEQADAAARKVAVTYSDVKRPVLSVDEAIDAQAFHPSFMGPSTIGQPDGKYKCFVVCCSCLFVFVVFCFVFNSMSTQPKFRK
jgi:hypothetical protein